MLTRGILLFLFSFFSFFFLNISKEFKKTQQKTGWESSLILSVVTEGRGGHARRGRLLCKLGCLKHNKGGKRLHDGLKSQNCIQSVIKLYQKLLTSRELWRSKPRKQDTSALYQCQEDAPHSCWAHHSYRSICSGTAKNQHSVPTGTQVAKCPL